MPERSDLMDDSRLPDGTAASQAPAAGCTKCSAGDFKRGFMAVDQRATPEYDVADNRPELLDADMINKVPGFLGRSEGWQR